MSGVLPVGAPLVAQYIVALEDALPVDVRDLPVTSARYRAALHSAAVREGWRLQPSRRELARGAVYLASLAVRR